MKICEPPNRFWEITFPILRSTMARIANSLKNLLPASDCRKKVFFGQGAEEAKRKQISSRETNRLHDLCFLQDHKYRRPSLGFLSLNSSCGCWHPPECAKYRNNGRVQVRRTMFHHRTNKMSQRKKHKQGTTPDRARTACQKRSENLDLQCG